MYRCEADRHNKGRNFCITTTGNKRNLPPRAFAKNVPTAQIETTTFGTKTESRRFYIENYVCVIKWFVWWFDRWRPGINNSSAVLTRAAQTD